jgi:aryl-alcohol dehydrogenase-like predicted oxidoreductase
MRSLHFSTTRLFRAIELEVLPFCRARGIGVLAYSPLMQGLLTGSWASADEVPAYRARTRHFDGARPKSRRARARGSNPRRGRRVAMGRAAATHAVCLRRCG